MTWAEFISSGWALLTGMLLASVPGFWTLYSIQKKYNMEGGEEKVRTDLAAKNLEMAQQASAYAKDLQEQINAVNAEKEKLLDDLMRERTEFNKVIASNVSRIQDHEREIKQLKDRVIELEEQLKIETQKTIDQELEIRSLERLIKRKSSARERSTDLE